MISFAESSFFPIPPDPVLINQTFVHPKKWRRLATLTLIASVLGGILGYLIGWVLFSTVGQAIVDFYDAQDAFDHLGEVFRDYGLVTIFVAAITPIPYKLFTIAAGAFSLNIFVFVLASILGRASRFYAVAWIANILGEKYQDRIRKYVDAFSLAIVALVILILLFYSIK